MSSHSDVILTQRESSLAQGILYIILFLALVAAFVVVTLVVFVVITFVRYRQKSKSLWITLGVCIALCTIGVLLTRLFSIGAFLLLLPIGIAVLLIACLVTWLKESNTLLPENVNIIDRVLHASSWWNFDGDRPLEKENERLAA